MLRLRTLQLALISTALPAALAWDHYVTVGKDTQLAFEPPYVNADVGDRVKFQFFPKNHTLTQSSFDKPCEPLAWGIDSGFKFVQDNYHTVWFEFEVKSKDVQWFHCMQTNPKSHCQAGMVFAVNPDNYSSKSFDAFKKNAMNSGNYGQGQGYEQGQNQGYGQEQSQGNGQGQNQNYGQGQNQGYGQDKSYGDGGYGSPTDHKVIVGPNGQLVYSPNNIQANVGDTVTFEFQPKNHTVTQSSFENPCMSNGGFKSGFRPVSANNSYGSTETFKMTLNDTKPVWIYCGQKQPVNHCQSGMVMAINAPSSGNTFDAFLAKAKASGQQGGNGYNQASSGSGQGYGQDKSYDGNDNKSGQNYGAPTEHKIVVGAGGQLVYSPNNIQANVGDIVTFEFQPKNHTVTQSSFDNPCTSNGGFKSGFRPVSTNSSYRSTETFKVTVNDTKPIWVYCGQKVPVNHCQSGMVMAINAPSSGNTFDAFLAKTKLSGGASSSGSSNSTYGGSDTSKLSSALEGGSSEGGDSWSKYMPVVVGLLGANLLIGLILVILGVALYVRRGGKGTARSIPTYYAPVKTKDDVPRPGTSYRDDDRPYSEQ